jgi:hypothetical protein
MDDIVRLQPKATYATLSAALTLSRGRRVALVFPVGERTCLHDTDALRALHTRCRLLEKSAVIIGGDSWLRAHAVASGFETATSLEDWGETAPELTTLRMRHVRRAGNGTPRLWLVAPQPPVDDIADDDHDDDGWTSEPPDFVIELRQAFTRDVPATGMPGLTLALSAAPLEDDDDPLTASERLEEALVGRILATSGIRRHALPSGL